MDTYRKFKVIIIGEEVEKEYTTESLNVVQALQEACISWDSDTGSADILEAKVI